MRWPTAGSRVGRSWQGGSVSRRDLVFNVAALGASSAAIGSTYFALSILVARELGVGPLGVLSVAVTISLLGNRVAELGIHPIVVRDIARDPDRGAAILSAGIRSRLVTGGIAIAVTMFALILVSASWELVIVTSLMTGFMLLHSLARIVLAFAHAQLRMQWETAVLVPAAIVIVLMGWWVLVLGASLFAVASVYALVGIAELGVAWMLRARYVGVGAGPGRTRTVGSILRESWPIGIAGLAAFLSYRVDTLMLSRLTDDVTTGVYNMAFNLLYVPNLAFWSLTGAAFPMLASAAGIGDHSRLTAVYRRLIAAALGGGMLVLLALPFARQILWMVYGEAGTVGSSILRWLLVSQLFSFLAAAAGTTMNATGRQHWALMAGIGGLAINVGLNAYLIPTSGAEGAALATVATELSLAVVGLVLLGRAGISLRAGISRVPL